MDGLLLLAPLLAPAPYAATDLSVRLEGSSWRHPLGTDDLGRDVLSRVLFGARVSLAVTALSLALALVIGTGVGLLSGYLGGLTDMVTGRLVDILLALPGILLAIALVAYVGRGFAPLVLALSCTAWVGYARVARALALTCASGSSSSPAAPREQARSTSSGGTSCPRPPPSWPPRPRPGLPGCCSPKRDSHSWAWACNRPSPPGGKCSPRVAMFCWRPLIWLSCPAL